MDFAQEKWWFSIVMLVYQRVTHTWSILKPPSKFHHIPRSKMTGNAFGWWTVDINGMFSRPCFGFFRGRFTINKQQDKPKLWPILHVLLVKPMWSTPLKRLSCKFCAPLRTLMSIHDPPSRLAGTRAPASWIQVDTGNHAYKGAYFVYGILQGEAP